MFLRSVFSSSALLRVQGIKSSLILSHGMENEFVIRLRNRVLMASQNTLPLAFPRTNDALGNVMPPPPPPSAKVARMPNKLVFWKTNPNPKHPRSQIDNSDVQ